MPLKNGRARKSGHFVVGTRAGKEQRKRCLLSHKPIVQYYYVVLCEFESERKWIVGAVPTTWQKLKVFDENFVDKANTFLWHIYKKEDTFAWIDLSIDNTIYLLL